MLWGKKKKKKKEKKKWRNNLIGKPGLCGHLTREVLSSDTYLILLALWEVEAMSVQFLKYRAVLAFRLCIKVLESMPTYFNFLSFGRNCLETS
jgi:hypothetical protein